MVLSLALRFPLGLFNNLLVAQQRWDLQNLGNFVSTALYAILVAALVPNMGHGLVVLGAVTLGTSLVRLTLPLFWLKRELPELKITRRHVSRAQIRELTTFSSSNFLVQVAQKIVFSTDVIVIGIVLGAVATGAYGPAAKLFAMAFGIGTAVTSMMLPAFAELEGAGDVARQRSLLLSGLRAGMATMLLLALPLLLIPDLLIHAWLGPEFHSTYAPMAILAVVLLIHQPIYVLTQFLIARSLQREIAVVSIIITGRQPRAVGPARVDVGNLGCCALDARHRRGDARLDRPALRGSRGVVDERRACTCDRSSGAARARCGGARARRACPGVVAEHPARARSAGCALGSRLYRRTLALRLFGHRACRFRSGALSHPPPPSGAGDGGRLARGEVAVEDLVLVPPGEHIPVELAPGSVRRFDISRARGRRCQ